MHETPHTMQLVQLFKQRQYGWDMATTARSAGYEMWDLLYQARRQALLTPAVPPIGSTTSTMPACLAHLTEIQ